MKHVITDRKLRRKIRVSKNITGTLDKPRITIFRSNRYIYAQAIDDMSRSTIVSASSLSLTKNPEFKKGKKKDDAREVGMILAKALLGKKIEKGVFDRGMYSYKGRVKSLADGLREAGLKI